MGRGFGGWKRISGRAENRCEKEGRKRGFVGAFNREFLEMSCGDDGSGFGKWANVRGGSVGGDMWKRMKEARNECGEECEGRGLDG